MKSKWKKKVKRSSKVFLLHVRINAPAWDYDEGQLIIVPCYAWSGWHAIEKFHNERSGSEFPPFNIEKIEKTDDFLFCPHLPGLKTWLDGK